MRRSRVTILILLYCITATILFAGLNGFVTERLRQDLIWNRTVNLRGGRGKNDEADLVNEFLNREFKGTFLLLILICNEFRK